jgi:hypothetical protein
MGEISCAGADSISRVMQTCFWNWQTNDHTRYNIVKTADGNPFTRLQWLARVEVNPLEDSVMDCYCDYEPARFYYAIMRKARKPQKCAECRRTIAVGERYEHVSGKWDVSLDTFKTCTHCLDIRQFVKNSIPCFCWAHGNMQDDAKETIREAIWRSPSEMKGVWFAYGRLVIASRNAGKALT